MIIAIGNGKPETKLRAITDYESQILKHILTGKLYIAQTPTFMEQIWSIEKNEFI